MNIKIGGLKKREGDDPDYADFWLILTHVNYHSVENAYIEWEVPVTKAQLKSIWNEIPKEIKRIGENLRIDFEGD